MNIYDLFDLMQTRNIAFNTLTDSKDHDLLDYAFRYNATGIINSLSHNANLLIESIDQAADDCATSESPHLANLHQAARDGDVNQVMHLIEHEGAEVNWQDDHHPNHATALHYALQYNQAQIAQLLVENYGAKFIVDDDASLYSKLLGLDVQIDLNQLVDHEGNTLLHIAALQCDNELLKSLITQHELTVQAINHQGKTALDLAIENNSHSTVKAIIDSVESSIETIGALRVHHEIPKMDLPHCPTHKSDLTLTHALLCDYSVDNLVKLATKYFIDVNQQDSHGRTALHTAVGLREDYVHALLHKLHADPAIQDNEQNTPLDLLVKNLYHAQQKNESYRHIRHLSQAKNWKLQYEPNISMGLELLKSGVKQKFSKYIYFLSQDWSDLMTLSSDVLSNPRNELLACSDYWAAIDYEFILTRHNDYLEAFFSGFQNSGLSAFMFSAKEQSVNQAHDINDNASSSSQEHLNLGHLPKDALKIIGTFFKQTISLTAILKSYPLEVILQKWRLAKIQVDLKFDELEHNVVQRSSKFVLNQYSLSASAQLEMLADSLSDTLLVCDVTENALSDHQNDLSKDSQSAQSKMDTPR